LVDQAMERAEDYDLPSEALRRTRTVGTMVEKTT
jgi:hypothetical protein